MRSYLDFTKFGIVFFVLVSGVLGYWMSLPMGGEGPVHWVKFLHFILGLYCISSGSFALNQVQEWKTDALMKRTVGRIVPSGVIKPWQGILFSIVFVAFGLWQLALASSLAMWLGALTVVLYNGLYTLIWKRNWAFGAVPGAIPGAMPVMIGYACNTQQIMTSESLFLFLIMYLWQMPHFWCLAIRYKEDYRNGGFPILPVSRGIPETLIYVGVFLFLYVAVALLAPVFLDVKYLYIIFVIPLSLKLIYEFIKYFRSEGQEKWLSFFLWVNFSMIIFLLVPALERWIKH